MSDLPSPIHFPVSNNGIREGLDALLAWADDLGIPRPVAHRIAVIVDEYCSNLIRHDSSMTSDSEFSLSLSKISGGAVIEIRDQAQPFDPTLDRGALNREIGGQGIVLMKGLSASLSYEASPDGNVFRATVLEE